MENADGPTFDLNGPQLPLLEWKLEEGQTFEFVVESTLKRSTARLSASPSGEQLRLPSGERQEWVCYDVDQSRRGNSNGDGSIEIGDALNMLRKLFMDETEDARVKP